MATNITQQEDNFLRIVYLNYRVGTTALRRFFDHVHPNLPSDLSSQTNMSILASLHKPHRGQRKILYQDQWDILYPPSGSQLVSSADLDVTLMVCLLRNLPPPVSQPLTGFDVLPPSSDSSPGAHIARIKYYKNFLVSHSKDGKLGDVGFNTIWIDMEMAINGLGNQQDVKDATEAKFKSLDYNSLKELVHLDRRLCDHTNIIDQHTIKIAKLETTVEVMEKEVQLVKKDLQVGTPNDFMTDRITKWEEDDILYIETRATKHVLSCVSKYKCVSVIGPSGCGKTALVRHVALQLQRNGYTILTVIDAKQIKEYYKPERKTLYIVDDMCGNFTANQARLDEWKKSNNDIDGTLQNGNCKLILTCRLQVFQDEGFENLKKFFKIRICDITSPDLSLTYKEKIKMTSRFFAENALKALKQLGEYECLPLLCKFYYGFIRDDPQFKPEYFLNEPFLFYKKHLDLMYTDCIEGKYKYYVLLLLVIFNNKLEEKQFSGKNCEVDKTIKDIIEIIDKDENITGRNLRSNLKTLTGTFLNYNESFYKCIHDKLFDFLAVYFGKKTEFIKVLIKLAKPQFVQERFAVAEENKKTVSDNANNLIPVLKDTLQMYLKRVLDDLAVSSNVNRFISGNINFKNVKFNTLFLHYMKHLEKKEIGELMQSVNSDFFHKLFVTTEHDIIYQVDSWYLKYQLFGIVIPGDMIQLYSERLFDHLTKTHKVKDFVNNCRPLKDVQFRSALSMYIRQQNTKVIASVMQTGSRDFFHRMFVMTEYDIKDKDDCQFELYRMFEKTEYDDCLFKCIGIVIPEDLLHEYIELWFEELKKADDFRIFLEKSRPLENFTFRTILHTYITKLNTNIGVSIIRAGNEEFFNEMFVMTKHDIDDNGIDRSYFCGSGNPYDFGMVIPDDILNQYIERWLDYFTQCYSLFDSSRPCRNPTFVTAVRKYMRQLTAEKIASIIQTSSKDFLYHGFVMTEDEIKEDSQYIDEMFGIIISSYMLKRYIERWFRYFKEGSYMKNITARSRLLSNVKFRTYLRTYIKELNTENIATLIQTGNQDFLYSAFVISEDDINWEGKYVYELFGIVIPNELLKSYIERSFLHFKEGSNMTKLTDESKLFSNGIFRAAVRTYINEFTTEKVASLIQTESKEFLNGMFIMSEDDIKDNAKYTYAYFCIVIPVIMLQQYIERWFNYLKYLTNATQLKEFINNCRPMMNGTFRTALRDYIRQLSKQTTASLIQDRNPDFVNTMFIMSEDDIKDSAEIRYESFGILIPNDLLQQYIERWFYHLMVTNSLKGFIKNCRPLRNVSFRIALHKFLRELSKEKIADLIHTTHQHFIRRMLVMSEDNISDTGENCYKCFGIVVPDDLLQIYIEELLNNNHHCSFRDDNWVYGRRHMMNLRFRTAVRIYIGQLSSHRITELLRSVGDMFFDELYVMTIDDMNENDEVTDDMLKYHNHMIERLLDRLSKTDDVNGFIYGIGDLRRHGFDIDRQRSSDMIRNKLRTGLPIYTRQVRTAQISDLIRTGTNDFLNRMFVITKDEIKDTSRYEFFGIVIPDILKQQYIERWFNGLTEANSVRYYMSNNRPLKNETFRSSVRTYMRELNTEQIAALIHDGNDDFLSKMFVMTDGPIVDNLDNPCECFGIVVPVDSVQHYVERLFHCLANTKRVKEFFNTGRTVMNDTFLTALRSYMRHLNVEEIAALIRTGSSDFLNKMFVMTKEDIKDHDTNRYDCLAIVIPGDMLQLFVERLFDNFAKSDKVTEFMKSSKPLMNAVCRTTMCAFMRQLNKDKIFSLMQTVSGDFLSRMFVITEEDIECNAGKLYECIGIVIPGDLLEHYIKCWIQHVIETSKVNEFMNSSRTLMNGTFRTALRTYMRQLNIYKMDYLIQTVSDEFFEKIFEMSKDGSEDNDILAYYIERWFERLTTVKKPKDFMDKSRHLMNDTICTALRFYMEQLSTEKVAVLIQTGNEDFFNTMFVVSKNDIKDNAKSLYECFGIVIPDSLLQLYIESWLERITKTVCLDIFIYESRPLKTDTFRTILCSYIMTLTSEKIACIISTANDEFLYEMFVITDSDMTEHSKNRYESLSIVVPGQLLQYFLERWFQRLNKTYRKIEEFMQENRQLMNETFCAALRSYMRHLSIEQIATLIQNGDDDFFHNMFVVMEDDIKEDSNFRYECFGIVIPNDLLHQYIKRWFNCLSKYSSIWIKSFTNLLRPLKNITFRVAVRSYIQQLNTETISSLVNHRNPDFHNTMFVMAEDDFEDDDENLYESVGIVIPGHLLQQYIELWFENMTTTDKPKDFMNNSRPLKNKTYITALRTYMKQLNTCKIASLIQNLHENSFDTMSESSCSLYKAKHMHNRNDEFLNTMFVMTEDDMKDTGDYLYELVGIVIPSELVQHYLEIWFEHLTKTSRMEEFMNESRPLMNTTFRTALQNYMRQLKTKIVHSLIKKVSNEFMNKMFVMTEDDINDNDTNRCECFGIIIPCDLIQVYIKRWFVVLKQSLYTRKDILNSSRPWRSVLFRNGVRTYMRHMNTDEMKHLIKIDEEFYQKMFVMIDDDFNDNTHNPNDMLQHCIETWFSHLTRSGKVNKIMEDNRPFLHVIFRTTLRIYMEQLTTEQIDYFIQTGSSCFVNTMFVVKDYDIKDNAENPNECFGIVLPGEMLQKYIEKWFDHLTKSDRVKEFINENRPLVHVTVITAMRFYMKQLTTERISSLIQTGSNCFINTMFVMTEDNIKDYAENGYECLGIVLPKDLLLQYIVKWFPRKNTTTTLKEFLNDNRLLMNDTFRNALRTFMNDSKTELIASLIQNPSIDIFNTIFVMTEDDIKDNAGNLYECFGLVIADNMLNAYIYQWVEYLKYAKSVVDYMKENRPLMNVTFQTALRTYFNQLNTEDIEALIRTGRRDFLNKMFVMTKEDIKDEIDNQFECFGIVIPCQLLKQYFEKWMEDISHKYEFYCRRNWIKLEKEANRLMKSVAFRAAFCMYIRQFSTKEIKTIITKGNCHFLNAMFVMSDDDIAGINTNRYEWTGIVIPHGFLRLYIEQWFDVLSNTESIKEFVNINRPLMNIRCQTLLRTYIRRLNRKAIENLIQTGSRDFINLMFVMIDDDIKYSTENLYECFGIVIPGDLLNLYIRRWFNDMTQIDSVKKYIDSNRCVTNGKFRKTLQTFFRQKNGEKISSLIQTGSRDFVNTMFVATESDIKDNLAVNRYECFGIVVSDDLLHQYIEKRFNSWTQTDSIKECIDTCRVLVNVIGWKAMQNYIKQINEDKIGSLIHTGSRNFINTMFVMTEDDIKDNADNRYECFGIVLPQNCLHQYIGRLFDGLTKADSVETCIDVNRCFKHGRFRTSLETYTKTLSRGKIGNLIRSGSRDFVNTMFFMTENDITNGSEKLNNSFGIVIPDDLLNQYIERWFDGITETDSAKHYIDVNRTFMNSKFQANLDSYINGINSERIKFLNRKGNIDFLNTRRDLFKETS